MSPTIPLLASAVLPIPLQNIPQIEAARNNGEKPDLQTTFRPFPIYGMNLIFALIVGHILFDTGRSL
jgi:hypothetical protein